LVREEFLAAKSPKNIWSTVSAIPPAAPAIPAVLFIPFKPLVAFNCYIILTVELPSMPAFVKSELPVAIPN
jgi:hypothetical protein